MRLLRLANQLSRLDVVKLVAVKVDSGCAIEVHDSRAGKKLELKLQVGLSQEEGY